MRITIIGGGNMGGAIIKGLTNTKIATETEITVTAKTDKTLHSLKAACPQILNSKSNSDAVGNADVIIIAVKPYLVGQIISEIRSKLDFSKQTLISVAAGVSFSDIENVLCSKPPLFRVLPNTAISCQESMTIVSSKNANKTSEQQILSLFGFLGRTVLVSEAQLNEYTALCSCGIAFALRYLRACIDGAVEIGIPPAEAKQLAAQTLRGAAALAEKGNIDEEIYRVTTPGGITIKGVNKLEEKGFGSAVVEALRITAKE